MVMDFPKDVLIETWKIAPSIAPCYAWGFFRYPVCSKLLLSKHQLGHGDTNADGDGDAMV